MNKPSIPTYVAEYIEYYRDSRLTVSEWFTKEDDIEDQVSFEERTFKWLYDNSYETNCEREHILHNAIREGYSVQKEKLYKVTFLEDRHTLTRRSATVTFPYNFTILWEYSEEIKQLRLDNPSVDLFTEDEIKGIDEKYWDFAVEQHQK